MKIIAVGDTHGRNIWENILEQEKEFDKFIFIGDYFDSREGISVSEQIDNFKRILNFKLKYPNKVILLLGNHDYHYLNNVIDRYSNYQVRGSKMINEILQPAVDSGLLQMCYKYDKFVFTHAGITKTWCEEYDINIDNLVDDVNLLFTNDLSAFSFQIGENEDYSGNDITQSPIWVRIPSLYKDHLDNLTFIVGHSEMLQFLLDNPDSEYTHFLERMALADYSYEFRKFADKLKDIICVLLNCTRQELEDRVFKETPIEGWERIKVTINNECNIKELFLVLLKTLIKLN